MDDSKLNELFKDFRSKYPKMDYFTQEEIFQYMRIAFHLGYDSKKQGGKVSIKIIRSDGKKYLSISDAARKNKISDRQIRRSLKGEMKAAGYNWKYKTKQP